MRFLTALVVAVAGAVMLGAQVTPAQQQATFKAGVNFVRIDVYPTLAGKVVPDLTQDEFEVLEDGVPQRIATFEHVAPRPDMFAERVDPATLAESNRMVADPRVRAFVLFLDTYHVRNQQPSGTEGLASSTRTPVPPGRKPIGPEPIDRALIDFLDRVVAPEDLVAPMTPEMEPALLTFARRQGSFREFLTTLWGRKTGDVDPIEQRFRICYSDPNERTKVDVEELIARRREDLTIQKLRAVVRRVADLREARKAILVVSEGWHLFAPSAALAQPLTNQPLPSGPGIVVGRDGKLALGDDPRTTNSVSMRECESERFRLADLNNQLEFRKLLDEANRTNTSFYPVNPHGLQPAVNKRWDENLRTLATATDGLPLMDSNNLTMSFARAAADLSDYYLLGYNSSNGSADGKFRQITVRVKRPGVTVRTRRGYYAPTDSDIASSRSAAEAADPEHQERERALASLATLRSDRPMHAAAGYAWTGSNAGQAPRPMLWIAADLDFQAWRRVPWSSGGNASVTITTADEKPVATHQADLPALAPRFLVRLVDVAVEPGEYIVRVHVQPKLGAADEATDIVRLTVPASTDFSLSAPPLLFRRGPFTGSGFQPTADVRFRKAERLRADVPVPGEAAAVSARLLDRKGQALPIPVVAQSREEGGLRFASAEISLAPLAQADYLIEISAKSGEKLVKRLIPFRVVP